jgi:hypothetical protein
LRGVSWCVLQHTDGLYAPHCILEEILEEIVMNNLGPIQRLITDAIKEMLACNNNSVNGTNISSINMDIKGDAEPVRIELTKQLLSHGKCEIDLSYEIGQMRSKTYRSVISENRVCPACGRKEVDVTRLYNTGDTQPFVTYFTYKYCGKGCNTLAQEGR